MNDTLRQDAISRVGITIAIDGPAGSGKSTVSKELASRLGIGYLDTGAMYRALTWYVLDRGIDLEDTDAVAAAANEMVLRLQSDPADPHVWVGETEVTAAIREPRIALAIKHISTNLKVRAWMAAEQRRRMMEARQQGSGMIAEGRDITTVVCPDADVRILLLADQEARLRRRTLELYGDATEEHMEIVRAQVEGRDKADSAVSEFMTAAPGVETVDSTGLDVAGVCEAMRAYVAEDRAARDAGAQNACEGSERIARTPRRCCLRTEGRLCRCRSAHPHHVSIGFGCAGGGAQSSDRWAGTGRSPVRPAGADSSPADWEHPHTRSRCLASSMCHRRSAGRASLVVRKEPHCCRQG